MGAHRAEPALLDGGIANLVVLNPGPLDFLSDPAQGYVALSRWATRPWPSTLGSSEPKRPVEAGKLSRSELHPSSPLGRPSHARSWIESIYQAFSSRPVIWQFMLIVVG